jgi:hypothetical protein
MFRAVKQGAFAGSDIASDEREIAGHAAMYRSESGEAGVVGSNPTRSTILPDRFVIQMAYLSAYFGIFIALLSIGRGFGT